MVTAANPLGRKQLKDATEAQWNNKLISTRLFRPLYRTGTEMRMFILKRAGYRRGHMQKDFTPRLLLAVFGLVSGCIADAADPAVKGAVIERAAPSVVLVTGYMGRDSRPYRQASGFFVDDEGLLVSVSNVFTKPEGRRLCERYEVRMRDGTELEARMHSIDALLNLILLKVTRSGTYPAVDTSARTNPRSGDPVLALAGSKTPRHTLTTSGYITAKHRKSVYGAGLGDMFIDSHIRIPFIAYGGPLLNNEGDVIGINTPDVHRPDDQAPNPEEAHALPLRVVKSFLRMAKRYPVSEQSWIGLAYRPLTPAEKSAAYEHIGQRVGVLIDYVWPEGPAGRLDIRPRDILFSVNGEYLRHLHELDRLLFDLEPGAPLELALLRDGQGLHRTVTAENRPPWAGHVNWRRALINTSNTPEGLSTNAKE